MQQTQIFNDDCLKILKKIESNSIDSIVTDPPAGIGFLGHKWDANKGGRDQWVEWMSTIMTECFRVLKPGGHMIVWALPRTSHWTATAVESAGFDIRDIITHIFNSGVPTSGDITKRIDKELGVESKVIGFKQNPCSRYYNGKTRTTPIPILEPQSDEAKKWKGWMPKLKPASEHWILARKPLSEKNLAKNIIKHRTGLLNIGGCKVKSYDEKEIDKVAKLRFPTNIVVSHHNDCNDNECSPICKVVEFDKQANLKSSDYFNTFFYSPKAPKHERLEGVVNE